MNEPFSRRFTEEETKAIIQQAVDRQVKSTTPGTDDAQGYTLAEIQDIAAEAGVRPEHVLAAAKGMAVQPATRKGIRLSGVPETFTVTTEVPTSVDDREWEAMVNALRDEFKVNGSVSQFGDVREWHSTGHAGGERFAKLRLDPEDGIARIEVTQSAMGPEILSAVGLSVFGMFTALFGIGVAVEGVPIAVPAIFGALTVASVFGTRLWAPRWLEKKKQRLSLLLDRLSLLARSRDHRHEALPPAEGES